MDIREQANQLKNTYLPLLKVPQLKDQLRVANLAISGRKTELIARLHAYINSQLTLYSTSTDAAGRAFHEAQIRGLFRSVLTAAVGHERASAILNSINLHPTANTAAVRVNQPRLAAAVPVQIQPRASVSMTNQNEALFAEMVGLLRQQQQLNRLHSASPTPPSHSPALVTAAGHMPIIGQLNSVNSSSNLTTNNNSTASARGNVARNYSRHYPFIRPLHQAVKPKSLVNFAKPPAKRCWKLIDTDLTLLNSTIHLTTLADSDLEYLYSIPTTRLFNMHQSKEKQDGESHDERCDRMMKPTYALFLYSNTTTDEMRLDFPLRPAVYVCNTKLTDVRFTALRNQPLSLPPIDLTPFMMAPLDDQSGSGSGVPQQREVVDYVHVHMAWEICTRPTSLSFWICQKYTPMSFFLAFIQHTPSRISAETSRVLFFGASSTKDSGTTTSNQNVATSTAAEDSDDDIFVTSSTTVSLRDPLSFLTIRVPVRGRSCKHVQCFDLLTYLNVNFQSPTWICPHCQKGGVGISKDVVRWVHEKTGQSELGLSYEEGQVGGVEAGTNELVICEYVWEMVVAAEKSDSDTVEIQPDGQWTVSGSGSGNASSDQDAAKPEGGEGDENDANEEDDAIRLSKRPRHNSTVIEDSDSDSVSDQVHQETLDLFLARSTTASSSLNQLGNVGSRSSIESELGVGSPSSDAGGSPMVHRRSSPATTRPAIEVIDLTMDSD